MFCALVAVLWMLGALRLLPGIDPMNMLTPFLIFAIAVSHGEQMINRFAASCSSVAWRTERWRSCARQGRGRRKPPRDSPSRMLLVPGSVALIAGCIGFATILLDSHPHHLRAGHHGEWPASR